MKIIKIISVKDFSTNKLRHIMMILFSKGYLHVLLLHIYGLSAQYITPSLGMYMYIREQAFVDCNISEVKGRFWGKYIFTNGESCGFGCFGGCLSLMV